MIRGVKSTQDLQVRNANGLSYAEIQARCPAVLQDEKHNSRSEKYGYVSTLEVLEGLKHEGLVPTFAMQSRCKLAEKTDYTKHLLRLRRVGDIGSSASDIPELVLINSHDGTSSYQMMSGIFRMICSNGLICGDVDQNVRIPHVGKNVMDAVITASYEAIDDSIVNMSIISEMKHTLLKPDERLLLAEFGMKARYGDDEELPYKPEKLLDVRRWDDRRNDLYTTYNVVQENLIKGGVHSRNANNKRTTSREIKSIDNNVKVNKLMWMFAEKMLEMKGAV
jgi:hypothetical protein